MSAHYLAKWELAEARGVVVVVDVLRAFTSAAYAFASGASSIWLVGTVDEALALAGEIPGALTMGEDHGRRPDGFDFSNSPVALANADLTGRVLVQRTSAGTQGAIAAKRATRLFAASLVCASATATAVGKTGSDEPTYVITGRFPDTPDGGEDDLATAQLIERARLGHDLEISATIDAVAQSRWARRLATLGGDDVHESDVAYCCDVDRFDFAMEVQRVGGGLRLVPVDVR
ncbi:MAG: 2-phosphosulfolactate phosphatase [Acidobacteriota bacterium]|nr:2-phosphosulfolactate phosphatase [Acidobacteriota bacterium]MDE3044567.1 2-phosphosulfolactate phosphatase [Acidobacteriota bacterium]MDE3107841.1 2-phosphosulfolactate phosphatase [Acidobacteriota bacterium]MDE3223576.1 2-phosphosulfolactate phosphatase [Acidobacteriota bacterium]